MRKLFTSLLLLLTISALALPQQLGGVGKIGGSGVVRRAAGGGSSTLLTGLVASWKLDDLADATGRGNTLTNNNVVTFNTGKIGNAAYLASASSQFLSIADNADVGIDGDNDFTIAGWVYLTTEAARMMIAAKDSDSSGREFMLYYDLGTDSLAFDVFNTDVSAFGGGVTPVSTGTWYCVIATYTASDNGVRISVNDGSETGDTLTGTPAAGTGQFRLGARVYSGFEEYWNGRLDNFNIWDRVLTSTERTCFYNSASGVEYPFTGVCP